MKFKILLFLIFAIALHNTVRNGDPTKFFENAYYKQKYSDEFSDNTEDKSVSYKDVVEEISNEKPVDMKNIVPISSVIYSPDVENLFVKKVSNGGKFVWGNCTWYVAQYRNVDWRGNAGNWLANAEAKGHLVGKIPVVGAIVVIKGAGYSRYGHVAIVTKVTSDSIFVRDMNNPGLNKINDHELSLSETPIRGYIYSDDDTQKNLISYLKQVVNKMAVK